MAHRDYDDDIMMDFDEINDEVEEDPELEHYAFNPDEEYEGEFGYWIVKMIRGQTTGRRLKRVFFKLSLFHGVCALALLIVALEERDSLSYSHYINNDRYGLSIQTLTWLVSIFGLIFAFASMMYVRYWASLVTNRELLCNLLLSYMVGCGLQFLFALWCACTVFLTFKRIKGDEWRDTVELATIFPCFVTSIVFLLPYLTAMFLYLLDISYLNDEVHTGGNIIEPDVPDDVMDLTDVTLTQSCFVIFAAPLIILIQLSDLIKATCKVCKPKKTESHIEVQPKKRRNIFQRIIRTILRCCRNMEKMVVPIQREAVAVDEDGKTAEQLRQVSADKEERERLERERQAEERARQDEAEKLKLKEAQEHERKRLEAERARIEDEERIRRQEEQRRAQEEEENKKKIPILNVQQYKALWTSLAISGSFQCKLKSMPTLEGFSEHMKKQGFHVVFAVCPNPNDVEVGICNIREAGQGPWFMARFLASDLSFSAVMKCENPDEVTQYVKRFSLAKILKIDTTK